MPPNSSCPRPSKRKPQKDFTLLRSAILTRSLPYPLVLARTRSRLYKLTTAPNRLYVQQNGLAISFRKALPWGTNRPTAQQSLASRCWRTSCRRDVTRTWVRGRSLALADSGAAAVMLERVCVSDSPTWLKEDLYMRTLHGGFCCLPASERTYRAYCVPIAVAESPSALHAAALRSREQLKFDPAGVAGQSVRGAVLPRWMSSSAGYRYRGLEMVLRWTLPVLERIPRKGPQDKVTTGSSS